MNVELVTKDDLRAFELSLLNKIEILFNSKPKEEEQYYLTKDLEREFKMCKSKQQIFRDSGKLPFVKIGDIVHYPKKKIDELVKTNQLSY
jgi:hypothetical protein